MLTDAHRKTLESCAIDPSLAEGLGVRSIIVPEDLPDELAWIGGRGAGISFPWVDYITGEVTEQIRLNTEYQGRKYLWPKGVGQKLARISGSSGLRVLLVEGFKQALAVRSTLGPDADQEYQILAMAGCYGTSTVDTSGLEDRDVTVILDADARKNSKVWDAAEGIQHQLEAIGCPVRFVIAPGTGRQGIDDVLASRKRISTRKAILDRLLSEASLTLPDKPNVVSLSAKQEEKKKKSASPFFSDTGAFLPLAMAENMLPGIMIFGHQDGSMRQYRDGVYQVMGPDDLGVHVSNMVGNAYVTSMNERTRISLLAAIRARGFYPGLMMDEPWLNTPSGMVHLETGERQPHSPDFYSTVQFGTEYDPDATCPVFDKWLAEMAGDQADSLMEHFAQILDPTRAPSKHIILEGPPGTGKSTMFRIIESVISGNDQGQSPFCTALTMKQLNEGGFHTCQLEGALFNSAGEMEAKEVPDITEFKMLTGNDLITANRKNKSHVSFRPRALFGFAMNEFPRIKDAEPYFRRVSPFFFGNQAGRDKPDQSIEERIRSQERSGVLNRLLEARIRVSKRGFVSPAKPEVESRFKGQTNPVLGWFFSEDNPFGPGWHKSSDVYDAYRATSVEMGENFLGQRQFSIHLANIDKVVKDRYSFDGKICRAFHFPERAGVTAEWAAVKRKPEPEPVMESKPVAEVPDDTVCVTFDLETTGLRGTFSDPPEQFIRLAGWKVGEGEVEISSDPRDVPVSEAGCLIGQNVVDFDLLALHRAGMFDLEKVATGEQLVLDTMILARHLNPPNARSTKERPYSLRKLAAKHGLSIDKDMLPALAEEFGGYGKIPQGDPRYIKYLKDDVEVTRKVAEMECRGSQNILRYADPEYQPEPSTLVGYLRREHRIAAIASLSRNTGVRVDSKLVRERIAKQEKRKAEILSWLNSDYGLPLGGKSPHRTNAGKEAIYNAFADLGVEDEDYLETEKGALSFGGDSMDNIASVYDDEEIAELAGVVKELTGQRTIYQNIADHTFGDGRVHPDIEFSQASGRWSITNPGLTVIGKRGRNANEREIIIPDDGNVFVCLDFSQLDARCVAALSQDEGYMAIFAEGRDLHTEIAVATFGDPAKRQQAKAIGHGVNYGRGAKGISVKEGIDLEICQKFIAGFREEFPDLVKWQDEVRVASDEGRLLDNGWGRKLHGNAERAYTQAPGLVGQSCARDIMCEALLRMDSELRHSFRLSIHDEFLMEFPEARAQELTERALAAMTFEYRGVPIIGEATRPAENWAACYTS